MYSQAIHPLCVDRAGTFIITITSMADDSAAIFLNGVYLANTGSYTTPATRTFIVGLREGCNCLEFDVHDLGCAVTGLDAFVDIQGGILRRPDCCDCDLCTAGRPGVENNEGIKGLSAVPNNSELAARPTLVSVPNPATGEATIHYVIDKDADAQVGLYNTAGKLIMVVDEGMRKTGQHAVPVAIKGLPRGAYRLQLKYGTTTLSIPLNIE
ncbi:MAG: Cellulase [Chlorobi bacterium]|nr:Cellulase [Chlorobiota bacterium]